MMATRPHEHTQVYKNAQKRRLEEEAERAHAARQEAEAVLEGKEAEWAAEREALLAELAQCQPAAEEGASSKEQAAKLQAAVDQLEAEAGEMSERITALEREVATLTPLVPKSVQLKNMMRLLVAKPISYGFLKKLADADYGKKKAGRPPAALEAAKDAAAATGFFLPTQNGTHKTAAYRANEVQARQEAQAAGKIKYANDKAAKDSTLKRRTGQVDPHNTETERTQIRNDKGAHFKYLEHDAGAAACAWSWCACRWRCPCASPACAGI